MKLHKLYVVLVAGLVMLGGKVSGQTGTAITPVLVSSWFMTNFVNDVVFGESGKGGALIFDGVTSGQRAVSALTGQAIGNGDFTLYIRCYVPRNPLPITSPVLMALSSAATGVGSAPYSILYTTTDNGILIFGLFSDGTNYRLYRVQNFFATYGGRIIDIAVVRNTTVPSVTFYINGLPVSAELQTVGTPPPVNMDLASAYFHTGNAVGTPWFDRIAKSAVYNYAMSAQEVLDISYQGTAPQAVGRFRSKIKYVNANGNFSGTSGNWTAIGGTAISYDTSNDELDLTVASGGDGVQLPQAGIEQLKPGVLHRVEFTIRNDASSLAKTVLWGSQTIGTCSGDGTFWFEFTPEATLADLKLTSAAGSFSLADVKLVEVGSAEGGKPELSYLSDFSAGEDGWTGGAGTVTGNLDHGGETDVLRFYASASSATHYMGYPISSMGISGRIRTRVSLKYYIPSANTTAKKLRVFYGIAPSGGVDIVTPAYDTWVDYFLDLDNADNGTLRIQLIDNSGNGTFIGAGTSTDDVIYFKNISVQEIAETTELANGGFDTAGNAGEGAFQWWVEAQAGSTVVSRETTAADTYSGGTARGSLKMVVDGSGSEGSVTAKYVTRTSRKYRLKFQAKSDSTTGVPTLVVKSGTVPVYTNTLTTSFALGTVDFVAASRNLTIASGTGTAGRTLWVDNVTLEDLGPVLNLDCAPGLGMQAHDLTVNGFHAVLKGDVRHAKPMRRAVIRGRTTTNGNEQLLGDYCIPPNGRIVSVTVTSDAAATVDLGHSSADASIVNDLAVVSGRQEVGTFLSRYSKTGAIWVSSSSTAALQWTIYYELVD